MNWGIELFICIAGCELVGIVGGLATARSVTTWYAKLKKPVFNPPGYIFGPVWTVLYALMGVSLFLVLNVPGDKTVPLVVFAIQLLLNFFWSFIFFYWKQLLWALVEILGLLIGIFLTMYFFYPFSPLAALLLIPYALWVSFATLLTGSVWILNKD